MTGWILLWAYIVILSAMVLAVRESAMRRTIWSLFGVMIAGYAYQFLIGNDWHYSAYMIGVNALACRIIVKEPAGMWQSVIGWSFVLQIGADTGRVAREINDGPSDITFLYWVTTAIAFAQLFLVIGWGIHAGVRRHRRQRHPDLLVAEAHIAGLA